MKWIGVFLILICNSAFSMPTPNRALHKKVGKYLTQGAIIGGQTGKGFSLLQLRRLSDGKKKMDRWVFEMGDMNSQPSLAKVPYYHIEIKEKPNKISIDLFQVHKSAINEEELNRILKQSPFVKEASMIYDTVDGGIHISVVLKKSIEVEVFEVLSKKKASRLVFDLKPI